MLTRLKWTGPTSYTDGSSFGEADLAGFRVFIDDQPAVDIPRAWNPDNQYEITFAELGLPLGRHRASVATVARNGQVSERSSEIVFDYVDDRIPNPPVSLQAV